MASETMSQTQSINFQRKPSPVSFFHMPMSPSEPGKFDFYRVYLFNQGRNNDSMFSDNSDGPNLTTSPATSSKQCWMSSCDLVSSNQSKLFPSSSINSRSFQESSVPCDTNSKSRGSESNVVSCPTLTDTVKKAMNKGQLLTTNSNSTRSVYHGTTLSTKDLNHLSPQSM